MAFYVVADLESGGLALRADHRVGYFFRLSLDGRAKCDSLGFGRVHRGRAAFWSRTSTRLSPLDVARLAFSIASAGQCRLGDQCVQQRVRGAGRDCRNDALFKFNAVDAG